MEAVFEHDNANQQTIKLDLTYDNLDAIRYELLRLTFKQIPIFSFSTLIMTVGIFFIFSHKVPDLYLLVWSALIFYPY